MALDSGNVGAYTKSGPSFTEAAFVKHSGLSNRSQAVGGHASSKFVASKAGAYHLVLNSEVPGDAELLRKINF